MDAEAVNTVLDESIEEGSYEGSYILNRICKITHCSSDVPPITRLHGEDAKASKAEQQTKDREEEVHFDEPVSNRRPSETQQLAERMSRGSLEEVSYVHLRTNVTTLTTISSVWTL